MKYNPRAVVAVLVVSLFMGLGVGYAAGASTAPTQTEAQGAINTLQRLVDAHYTPAPTTPPATTPPVTSPTPSPTPSAPSRPSGLAWSSGVFGSPAAFASGRGKPTDNVGVFPSRGSWSTSGGLLDPWWQGAVPAADRGRVDLVVGVPLFPQSNSLGNTGTDAQWRALADLIEAVDSDAYVRLAWEMNIPSSAWPLNAGNAAQWTAEWRRVATLMKSAAPSLRLVWNPNNGVDQTCTGCSRAAFQSLKDLIDVYAVDGYDNWPALVDAASEAKHLNDPGRLVDSWSYAVANGKKFALAEWGVSSGTQWAGNTGGDNARYITAYQNFIKQRAADIAFETYFNEPAPYCGCGLFTQNPNASAAYRAGLS